MPTNRTILNHGLKFMAWSLPLFFIGPTVINSAFKNTGHWLFIPVLGIGIIFCILAVVFLFRGLKNIVKSQTDT